MSYQFFPYLLLRRPVRDPDEYTMDIEKMLSNSHFLAALALATPIFYQRLHNSSFQAAGLSEKERQTITKYFNRFCFRPTPFGLFSSITLASWSEQGGNTIQAEPVYEAVVRADQTYQQMLAEPLASNSYYS